MQVQRLQPTLTQVAKRSASKKQLAEKALSKVAFNNIKASVAMASLNEAVKNKNNLCCFSMYGDNMPISLSC